MQLDFSLLLDNIKRRRFDEAIRDYVLSTSFLDDSIPQSVRYAMESMQEIDSAYSYKVYANTRRMQEAVKAFGGEMPPAVRYQGSLKTETHIRLYGEVDVLFLLDQSASSKSVFALGKYLRDWASRQNFQHVDYGDGLRIKLVTEKPACRINLIPGAWLDNPQFLQKKNEVYRGVVIYNFKEKTKKKLLPFLNIARINDKDYQCEGGVKRVVRLLKSLANDESVSLSTYELSGLVYQIDDEALTAESGRELSVLPTVMEYINSLVGDKERFETLVSPSEKELIFGSKPDRMEAVLKLKSSLEALITDLKGHVGSDLSSPVKYDGDTSGNSDSE